MKKNAKSDFTSELPNTSTETDTHEPGSQCEPTVIESSIPQEPSFQRDEAYIVVEEPLLSYEAILSDTIHEGSPQEPSDSQNLMEEAPEPHTPQEPPAQSVGEGQEHAQDQSAPVLTLDTDGKVHTTIEDEDYFFIF